MAIIGSSVLCVEITEDIRIDQTTCEDIIHSIYKLKNKLEEYDTGYWYGIYYYN